MAMTTESDIADILSSELKEILNIEICIAIRIKNGWYEAVAHNQDITEVKNWIKEHITYGHIGYDTVWAFENKEEFIEFTLRFCV